jgi:hypothetical protein
MAVSTGRRACSAQQARQQGSHDYLIRHPEPDVPARRPVRKIRPPASHQPVAPLALELRKVPGWSLASGPEQAPVGVARSSRAARAVPLDRAGGQPHSGQPLDHLRDLGGAPDFAVEAVGGWPLQECLLDQRQLAVGNRWPSAPPVNQPRRVAGAPAGPPADRGLAGDAELPGDRGRRVAGVEQRGRALPPPAGPPPAGGFRRRRPAAEPQTAPSGLPQTAWPPAPQASGPWRRCWPRPRAWPKDSRGWLVAARSGRTTPSGWPAGLGLQGGGPDGSGPAPTGRVAAPASTGPQTARDADRRDHSCRWRPLAAAPATPTVQPGWPPVAAGTPPGSRQETQGRCCI